MWRTGVATGNLQLQPAAEDDDDVVAVTGRKRSSNIRPRPCSGCWRVGHEADAAWETADVDAEAAMPRLAVSLTERDGDRRQGKATPKATATAAATPNTNAAMQHHRPY